MWEVEDEMLTVNFVTVDIWDCFGLRVFFMYFCDIHILQKNKNI